MNNKVLQGLPVCGGTAAGRVRIVTDVSHINQVEYGDILVIPNSHPRYAMGIMKAGGVICQEGGRLSHICIVALEMGVPCITQAENAVEIMKNKEQIFLDADKGVVYDA